MSTVGTVTEGTPLRTLLGDYPNTHAVRHGTVTSPRVPLAFADVPVPHKAFKRVVRDLEFDVAEIALMTFLMARSRGAALKLLPVVVFSRNPLPHLVCDRERGRLTPGGLPECRIAVRSYTTTTAVWMPRSTTSASCRATSAVAPSEIPEPESWANASPESLSRTR